MNEFMIEQLELIKRQQELMHEFMIAMLDKFKK